MINNDPMLVALGTSEIQVGSRRFVLTFGLVEDVENIGAWNAAALRHAVCLAHIRELTGKQLLTSDKVFILSVDMFSNN